jgi:hypothetical protein
MSHLSPERLAALIDEQPTAAELAHLAACRPCARERGAYEALAAMSQSHGSIGQPLTSWDRLAPALAKDGIMETHRSLGRRMRGARPWLQAAAAVLLMVGGAAFGRMTAPSSNVQVADLSLDTPNISSVEQAQALAAKSQNLYQASLAYLAGKDTSNLSYSTPAAIKTRLAALEQVTRIAGAALEDAPYDPVVNTLYLNAQGQREASMRMLNTTSARLTTY